MNIFLRVVCIVSSLFISCLGYYIIQIINTVNDTRFVEELHTENYSKVNPFTEIIGMFDTTLILFLAFIAISAWFYFIIKSLTKQKTYFH